MAHPVDSKYKRKRDHIMLSLKGFGMGMADVIPGISGGTIAFLVGIYEDLIEAIKSFDWHFVRLVFSFRIKEALNAVAWRFMAFLVAGIIGAIIILSKVVSYLLGEYPILVYAFFFGLISATVPLIARIIHPWNARKAFMAIIGALGAYWIVGLVPVNTPEEAWFLFLSGFIAISAMILPGISGAFILVLLGKYQFILDAVNQRDLISIGIFLLGIVVGIVTFVRVLSWLFHKHHDVTLALITGIVVGSLRKIWPWKEITETLITTKGKVIPIAEINIVPQAFSGEVLLAIALMIIGFIFAMATNRSSGGKLLSS